MFIQEIDLEVFTKVLGHLATIGDQLLDNLQLKVEEVKLL